MKLGAAITRNAALLGFFAVITAFLVSGTWLLTKTRIANAEQAAQERALLELIPRAQHSNNMLEDTLSLHPGDAGLGLIDAAKAYRARNQSGEVVAVILPVHASDGYSGGIDFIVGVRQDLSLAGIRVTRHRETPGLGDKIERKKSDWVEQFVGKSLTKPGADQWRVKKDGGDFDQLTGATITPRAVVSATARALDYAKRHYGALFEQHATNDSEAAHD